MSFLIAELLERHDRTTFEVYGYCASPEDGSELRARDEFSQVPAIMVSTESETKDSDRAFAAGANFYLIKPARPVELTTSVRLMLGEPA